MVQLTVKAKDAWWTVAAIDPIAAPVVRAVHGLRRVTPNRISAASLVTAVAAGASFAGGDLVLGAILFQLSFLLDCVDGKLAHTRGAASPYGGFVDAVVDTGRTAACYCGLAWTVAGRSGFSRADVVAVAAYPVLSYAVVLVGKAWPDRAFAAPLRLPASPLQFVRAIPRRLGRPLSGVDGEAVLFTLAPLAGAPVVGLWIAVAMNGVSLVAASSVRLRHVLQASAKPAAPDGAPSTAGTTS